MLKMLFNLGDHGWGRGGDGSSSNERPASPPPRRQQPEDVFSQVFQKGRDMFGSGGNRPGRRPPRSPKVARFGALFFVIVALLVWLATGFYIVREGQVGIVTQFGRYHQTVAPGFQWRLPSPIQKVELVNIARVRSFSVGYRDNARNKILPEALMLTEDENIVDVQFDVQYRLKSGIGEGKHSAAADYLFQTVAPDEAVRQAAETAMREIVGKQSMNKILYESRTQAAIDVRHLMQHILDRYRTGIEVITVAIQNVQPPEQVQAAFEDAIKAGQDNERQKNEGNAYASKVIPEARGQASRLIQDAEGYKAAVIGQATGAAQRFVSVEQEYAKAPQITRDRLYLSTLEQVYRNTSKVMIDAQHNNALLYLPVDKLLAPTPTAQPALPGESATTAPVAEVPTAPTAIPPAPAARTEFLRDRAAFQRIRPVQ